MPLGAGTQSTNDQIEDDNEERNYQVDSGVALAVFDGLLAAGGFNVDVQQEENAVDNLERQTQGEEDD